MALQPSSCAISIEMRPEIEQGTRASTFIFQNSSTYSGVPLEMLVAPSISALAATASMVYTRAPDRTSSLATVPPTDPQPWTRTVLPLKLSRTLSTAPSTPNAVASLGFTDSLAMAARTYGQSLDNKSISLVVVLRSQPVYMVPLSSCSNAAVAFISSSLFTFKTDLSAPEASQTIFAPANPVLYVACLTSMPCARPTASRSAA
mmetsp:Transcript_46962/g.147162  ORF Transcript_46962/g.147162 Transcript_46962/m.147162 type:complete len:204 (-) Transcript_46962:424-1035(-)